MLIFALMRPRVLLIALCGLAAAGLASAQPGPATSAGGVVLAGNFDDLRPARPLDRRDNYLPFRVSASINCPGGITYTVSVVRGSCNRHYPIDSDGNPLPYDYAQCANGSGSRAAASCQYGCAPTTGSGACVRH